MPGYFFAGGGENAAPAGVSGSDRSGVENAARYLVFDGKLP